jgi:hypothetical protein
MGGSVPATRVTYRRVGNLVTREVAGETIAIPVRANAAELDSIFTFNEVGSAVWALLDKAQDVAEIVASVAGTFEVAPDQARQDVVRFLDTLLEAGLVERQEG